MELELLTHAELATRLKVSVRTVRRMAADGTIPARQVRGRVRFYWPDVLAVLPPSGLARPARRPLSRVGPPISLTEQLRRTAADWHVVQPDELARARARKERER